MRENLFWAYIYLNYPSNKIIEIRKELDKKMTNVLFAEEPCYSISIWQIWSHFSVIFQIFWVLAHIRKKCEISTKHKIICVTESISTVFGFELMKLVIFSDV